MIERQHLLFTIVAAGIFNGLFSPILPYAVAGVRILAPGLLISSVSILFLLGSLLVSTFTIILAGIPAALFERATGRQESDPASMSVWLVSALVLAFPALRIAMSL